MICVRVNGGLGNQLFQYAAGRALAVRLNVDLVIDTSTLARKNSKVTPRHLELNHYRHAAIFLTASESRMLPWLDRLAVLSTWISPWHVFVEKNDTYSHGFEVLPDQTYLVGYWQSHRYFSGISKQLMSDLEPVDSLNNPSLAVADQIDSSTSVALHVRRGDYVSLASAASFHGTLAVSYYLAAMTYLRERVVAPKIFVFSDDTEWCRAHLSLGEGAVFVEHNAGVDAWQDLQLMSRCQHHVIANSSFSWWGAWLADQRRLGLHRVVIAPKRWFSHQTDLQLRDRFPSHWVMQ